MAAEMTNTAKEWTGAARRIREIEGYLVTGLVLEIHIDTEHGTDQGAFSHLDTGQRAAYVIERQAN